MLTVPETAIPLMIGSARNFEILVKISKFSKKKKNKNSDIYELTEWKRYRRSA